MMNFYHVSVASVAQKIKVITEIFVLENMFIFEVDVDDHKINLNFNLSL